MHSAFGYAAARHATVVAASGDYGAPGQPKIFGSSALVKEVSLPASDPLVLAVGGTTLTANPLTRAYVSETAWNSCTCTPTPVASGGGFSHLFARAAYQHGVPGVGATRGVPDVAASAWFDIALSMPGGSYELIQPSGTSADAPFWAGLIALADQEAGHPLGFVNPAIYRIARSPLYHEAFHDITTGNNTVVLTSPPVTITGYQAGRGWDPVTGWGTPGQFRPSLVLGDAPMERWPVLLEMPASASSLSGSYRSSSSGRRAGGGQVSTQIKWCRRPLQGLAGFTRMFRGSAARPVL